MVRMLRWIKTEKLSQREIRCANQITLGALAKRGLISQRGSKAVASQILEQYDGSEFVERKSEQNPSTAVVSALGLVRYRLKKNGKVKKAA